MSARVEVNVNGDVKVNNDDQVTVALKLTVQVHLHKSS
jgi:hypothetical protein